MVPDARVVPADVEQRESTGAVADAIARMEEAGASVPPDGLEASPDLHRVLAEG